MKTFFYRWPLLAGALIFSTPIGAATINRGSSFTAGTYKLDGNWKVIEGSMSLSSTEQTVFTMGSVVRGKLGTSYLPKAKFLDVDLQGVDFQTSDITEADFSWSDLKGAKLNKAKVSKAHFEKSFGLTSQQKQDLKKRGAFVANRNPLSKNKEL